MESQHKIARVLIADDQPLYREGLKSALAQERAGEVVGEAGGLDQVAAMAQRIQPDVVLLAEAIVGADSLDVVSNLCRSGAWRVIIIGEDDNGDAAVEWVKAGASGYISRRAERQQLAKAIRVAQKGELWIARRVAGLAVQQLREEKAPVAGKPLLSPREQEVIRLVARGWRNSEVAAALYISEKTVKTHLSSIFQKLGVRDRLQAALAAVKAGLADGRGTVQ